MSDRKPTAYQILRHRLVADEAAPEVAVQQLQQVTAVLHRQRRPVAQAQRLPALEQAAVDEQRRTLVAQQVLRADADRNRKGHRREPGVGVDQHRHGQPGDVGRQQEIDEAADAAAEVAKALGLPRRDLYRRAMELKGAKG